jgi:hypothetical protein
MADDAEDLVKRVEAATNRFMKTHRAAELLKTARDLPEPQEGGSRASSGVVVVPGRGQGQG